MLTKKQRSDTINVLIALLPILLISIYFYGFRTLIITSVAALISGVLDYICVRFLGQKKREKGDFSWLITAVVFSFAMSAAIPYWICFYGMLLAIVVAKAPFGGYGKNIFNPAGVGIAFVAISFQTQLFTYPAPYTKLGLESTLTDFATEMSPAFFLNGGGAPTMRQLDVIQSNYSGPMGATALIVLAACGLFLLLRRTIHFQTVFAAILSFSAVAFLFPRVSDSRIYSVGYELIAGLFLFVVVFMASDPVTTPKTGIGKVLFGCFLGVGTMLLRYFGGVDLAAIFPLLLGNALTPTFDRLAHKIYDRRHPKYAGLVVDETVTVEISSSILPEDLSGEDEVTEND